MRVAVALVAGICVSACSPAPVPAPAPPVAAVAPPPDAAPPDPPAPSAVVDAGPPPPPEAPAETYPQIPVGTGLRRPPKLAGACVDVLADLKKRGAPAPIEKPKRVDLDGDGKPDWIFTTDANAHAYSGHVYLARGACGHWVGEWEGSTPEAVKSWANGVSDLESGTPCKPTCCPTEAISLYRFDGTQYRKIGERTETKQCFGRIISPL